MPIEFYSTKAAYGEFSNFAPFPFMLDGKEWPTSEHYFQAQKFQDEAYREKIRTTKSPMIAARLGRSRKIPIRRDWEAVKVEIMRACVTAKVGAHERLRDLLLSTGDEEIVEAAVRDNFWGSGPDGKGENWLGRILMEIRSAMRAPANNQGTRR
jgi:ribA/ribD-fused uncharacterized protein